MVHAAAMLTGLWVLWLLLTQSWDSPLALALGGAVALACVLIAARFGVFQGGGGAFARAPQLMVLTLARGGEVLRGAMSVMRAAIAADVTLKPALVRVRTRATTDLARATMADMLSAAPGALVVDADPEGFLVHVLDEDAIDVVALGDLEARVIGAIEGKQGAAS